MLDHYEPHARNGSSRTESGEWTVIVALEYIRRFRGIRDGHEYLRARRGDESFEHRLVEEEALAQFTLRGETPSSLELNAEPIVMRVDNEGPSDEFEATVVEVTNSRRAPVPWHVRWRGTSEQKKEILTGSHWVLEIARDDATRGWDERDWTPGWVFLNPRDEETSVAPEGLGAQGTQYGLPMRVKVRVTPRSQPQRSLENTVTLWFSAQGRHVLWDFHRVPL